MVKPTSAAARNGNSATAFFPEKIYRKLSVGKIFTGRKTEDAIGGVSGKARFVIY
jgi:hypothetical protein